MDSPEGIRMAYRNSTAKRALKCANCMRTEDLFQDEMFSYCSRCRMAAYCSKTCQRLHWREEHKRECILVPEPAEVIVEKRKKRKLIRFMDTFEPLLIVVCTMQFSKLKLSGVSESDTVDYMMMVDLCTAGADGRALTIQRFSIVHRRNVRLRVQNFVRPPASAGQAYRTLLLRLEGVCQIDFIGTITDESTDLIQVVPPAMRETLLQSLCDDQMTIINEMAAGKRPDLMSAARQGANEGRAIAGPVAEAENARGLAAVAQMIRDHKSG